MLIYFSKPDKTFVAYYQVYEQVTVIYNVNSR